MEKLLDRVRRTFPFEAANQLIKLLDEAARVVILAEGLALTSARNLGAWLELGGHTVHYSAGSAADLARALAGLRRGDLVLAVEIDGETPMLARALEQAGRQGATTVALVATPSDEVTLHADLVLAGKSVPDPGLALMMLDGMAYALMRMLIKARPGRYQPVDGRIRDLTRALSGREGSDKGA